MMTFYHAQPAWGTDQDTLAVLYRTSPSSSWQYVASWSNNITDWQLDTVMLPNASSTYQVAFMAHSGFGLGILLDSIVVYGSESCTRPTFANVNVGSTTIAATWTSPANSFDVAVKPASSNVWPEPTRITDHNYTFTGLEPNTAYNFRVRSLCSDTSVSFWTTSNCVTDTLECYVPENLTIVETDFQNVTLSWNADLTNHAVAYVVNINNSAFSAYDTVYSNNVTITGLYPDMSYDVKVRAMCSATTYSDWSETLSFTTATCLPVADVTVSNVTSSSAVVTWTPQGDATAWTVSYGFMGYTQGSGIETTVTEPTYTFTGLDEMTTYDVYVRSACSEDVASLWSPVVRFTTLEYQGIATVDGNVTCTIYPNPADDATTISISGANGTVRIAVIDINGRTVASEEISCAGNCTKQMTVGSLAQGAYYVRVVGDQVNMVKKLMVR